MNPLRIAHVSDLHVMKGGVFEPDTFEQGLAQVNELEPDLVVVTGDLTDSGLRPEYEEAKERIERFDAPTLTCLGNHDARREGWLVYEEMFRKRYYRERVGDVDFIVLDTSEPDLNEGEVGREQRQWLCDQLETAEFPIVLLHHHVVPIPNSGREMNVMRDAGGVAYVLDAFDVPLVMGGHRHYPWAWRLNTTLVSHASTFSSNKRNWPAGFNVVDVEQDRIRITQHHTPGGAAKTLADVPVPQAWGGTATKMMEQVHEGGLKPVSPSATR